ncbi:RNA polymerase sigma factor [Flammeovirga kamogawensis]|uniref:RNA polymerase sigma factor n=1 Tax=Flammeovirga kamogawensis TaxID=373891 RepID=A0ABX8GW03_9BACT|nr:RNA polymerase sigma factor [Flammeovirga kamogawensis]MBB6461562.1 RNA polymerase sigma-70 factor (ECF subfamily) [Flammeovirga kamogawensis]QWG07506.1 RNA polymerase sigma factor [Flammeovirga kamogawensis]TRX69319.1 RNA polymerase sigma factor [Flammeovirga kamogawensis]
MTAILDKCKEGDRKAQFELYNQYSKAMYNICVRIVNNLEEAEDILQESFLSAFKNLHQFNGTSSFGAWLKRIVVNHSINHVKKRRLDLVEMEENNISSIPEKEEKDIDLILNIDRIREAIQLLPDGYRIVFSLYLLEGYDHREISQILSISESASKSQYSRAKKKLKDILKVSL